MKTGVNYLKKKEAVKYLRKIEWSLGNGQCPECFGAPPGWTGHPCYRNAASIGHKEDCDLARSLLGLGEKVFLLGDYTPSARTQVLLETYLRRHPDGELGSLGFLRELHAIFKETKEYDPAT